MIIKNIEYWIKLVTNIFWKNKYAIFFNLFKNKVYGIKIFFNVHGIAGKFGLIPLMSKIGVGLGLMGNLTILVQIK